MITQGLTSESATSSLSSIQHRRSRLSLQCVVALTLINFASVCSFVTVTRPQSSVSDVGVVAKSACSSQNHISHRSGLTVSSSTRTASIASSTTSRSTRRLARPKQVELQQVQPLRSVSDQARQRAVEALERQKDNEAQLLDARMLGLLSERLINSNTKNNHNNGHARPNGRPEMVPGAMKYETMLNFRKLAESASPPPAPATYIDMGMLGSDSTTTTTAATTDVEPKVTAAPKRGRGRPRKNPLKDATASRKESDATPNVKGSRKMQVSSAKLVRPKSLDEPLLRARKRVVKNLPKSKILVEESSNDEKTQSQEPQLPEFKYRQSVASDLQRYYRTELLTAKEEYSLGTKVQFMVKCESVHEGLAIRLERLPTIQEWAHACGFTDDDKSFYERESYADLRPAGCEDMFLVKDPNMFEGNGLACELGVGRGRGRAKKTPPKQLGAFYDDSENVFRQQGSPRIPAILVNTGTPFDFVDNLMDAKLAKQRMVSSNMRLVLSISRKYSNVGVNLQDLVQEGSLGLSRAAEKFDPKKGFKFSTYASWWIQQAVFRAIAYHSRTIRLPVHVHNLLNRIRKVRKTVEQDLGRPPTNEEMAKQLEMPVAKYNKMMRLTRRSISLESPKYQQNPKDFGHEGDDLLRDTIDAAIMNDEVRPEKRVDRNLFHEDLRQMLNILEDDELRVISARYGLEDGLTRTVTAVASQMKMPKAWVRSKECRALRKLRRPWYEKRLKEHQNSLTSL